MRLVVNENKTKYMAMTRTTSVKGTLRQRPNFRTGKGSRANINETNKQMKCVVKLR